MAKAICSIEGCEKVSTARTWCPAHWYRWRTHGDPLGGGIGHVGRAVDYPDGTRTCTKCGEQKPLEMFDRVANATLGRRSDCKSCRSAKVRTWYAANQQRQAQRQLKRYADNAVEIRERERVRYERDREKRREGADVRSARRRSRLKGARVDRGVTRENLRSQYGDLCFYCETPMLFIRLRRGDTKPTNLATIEHMHPVSLGGSHTWDNVVLACLSCNCSKRGSTLAEWNRRGWQPLGGLIQTQ